MRLLFALLAGGGACANDPADRPATWQCLHPAIVAPSCATSSYGSGPADARPSLTWIAPSTSVLDATTTGMATLMWTDADAEGLASDLVEYAKVSGPPSCNLATGCAQIAIATWKPVTMHTVTGTSRTQTFTWTTPSEGTGCYCVRGTVTDTAMQTTTVVTAKPVRF